MTGVRGYYPDPWDMTDAALRIRDECHEGHIVRKGPPEIEFWGLSDSDTDKSDVDCSCTNSNWQWALVPDEWSLDPGFY